MGEEVLNPESDRDSKLAHQLYKGWLIDHLNQVYFVKKLHELPDNYLSLVADITREGGVNLDQDS